MKKTLGIRYLLLLLSIFLLVANPFLSAFAKNHAKNQEVHVGQSLNINDTHFHNNSWAIIANRQLVTPPPILKVKGTIIVICAGLLLFILNIRILTLIGNPQKVCIRIQNFPSLYLLLGILLL